GLGLCQRNTDRRRATSGASEMRFRPAPAKAGPLTLAGGRRAALVPYPRSNRNLPRRPLDDLDQHLLALFDAEMAIVPIELVAAGVEIADRSGPLKVDLDALAHFLEGKENFVDFLARGIVNRWNLLRVHQRVRALGFLHCQRQRADLIVRVAGEQIERVLVRRAHQLLELLV